MLLAASISLLGCSSSGQPSSETQEEKMGHLGLPLVTQGASGVVYRLRDATFSISRYGYLSSGGAGGGGPTEVVTVSSETDPDAATISVSLEEGSYYVQLLPGWHFEKQTPSGYETVEATLLSGELQFVYVSRQSTSFAEYQFGLGEREIWLNGELNIGVVVYEHPSEVGFGGGAGFGGVAGFSGVAGGGGFAAGSPPVPGTAGGFP
ncbi:MAG: hypothetical protein EOO73_14440 [Myxococcales bacterium]|nr:MAG: hypothetical protein EOO73_14440 [Myxococcales bacterium]